VRKVTITSDLLRRVESDSRYRAARDSTANPEWREQALCISTTDPDVFFPAGPEDLEPARRICRTCPVAGACLAEALGRAEIDGVWGGTTSAERRTMRAVWRRDAGRHPVTV
jgi:WhiB family redox-sensing transcriptional regulator